MPKPRKPQAPAQRKPQVLTCMGFLDADDPLVGSSPLRRADGAAPYNSYFWPLPGDWYWANQELSQRYDSRWNFMVVALDDGTWLSEGSAYRAKPYPTRKAALRAAVARMIRTMRNARHWTGMNQLRPDDFRAIATWALGVVGRPAPRIRTEPPPPAPPPPPPAWSDLPLFAGERGEGA